MNPGDVGDDEPALSPLSILSELHHSREELSPGKESAFQFFLSCILLQLRGLYRYRKTLSILSELHPRESTDRGEQTESTFNSF